MLYQEANYKAPPVETKISIADFKSWVMEQDPKAGFNWRSLSKCPAGLYLEARQDIDHDTDIHIRIYRVISDFAGRHLDCNRNCPFGCGTFGSLQANLHELGA